MKVDRIAATMLLALGVLTLGSGVYFLVLRPAMLPEDVLFTGTAIEQLRPEMVAWLEIVFRTWGGFMAGFGLLLTSVAGYLLTSRIAVLKLGTSLSILFSFGRFLASNVRLHSDYVWFVGALFGVALLVSLLLLLGRFGRRASQESR